MSAPIRLTDLLADAPRSRSISAFMPSASDLEAQALDPSTLAEDWSGTPLLVRFAAAIIQARYSERDVKCLRTTLKNALKMDAQGYRLKPIGQLRYEVLGGDSTYTYDDGTESCTCPLWTERLRVCKHSIWAAGKLFEARALLSKETLL